MLPFFTKPPDGYFTVEINFLVTIYDKIVNLQLTLALDLNYVTKVC